MSIEPRQLLTNSMAIHDDEQGNIKHSLKRYRHPEIYDIPRTGQKNLPTTPEMNAKAPLHGCANPGASVADYISSIKGAMKIQYPCGYGTGVWKVVILSMEFLKFYREHPSNDIPDLMYTRPLGVAEVCKYA